MTKGFLGIIAIIAIVGLFFWSTYNRLISTNENVTSQWQQVENQYQRRFDLIPNLIESVKGILGQEQTVFGDIADARSRYSGATTADEKAAAATQVEGALGRLLVIMENYPQLRSTENVQALQAELAGAENRISVERKRYNDLVRDFNVMVKRIPTSWIAGMFSFSERTYFEAVEGSEKPPVVNLNISQ